MTVQAMFRRGGMLQGPRLVASVLAVFIVIFYFSAPVVRETTSEVTTWVSTTKTSYSSTSGDDITADDHRKEKEQETYADRFYDLVRGKDKPKASTTSSAPVATSTSSYAMTVDAMNDPMCEILSAGTKDLLVIVNTPASDLYTQLPSRFLTNLRCAPIVLFSTVEHYIGSYKVLDAISGVTQKIRQEQKEFELYRQIQTAQHAFQELTSFKQDGEHNLDKWMVVPSIIEAYKMHPDKKWFVFIEGDTYLSLPNVLSWVGQLNPDEAIYAGSQTTNGDTELAAASAGIVLSNAAVGRLAKVYDKRKSDWEALTTEKCCGDVVLGEVLKEVGVSLHRSFPNIQPESPLGIEWSNRHWCKAAVPWHQMTPPLMDMLWQFERNWTLSHHAKAVEAAAMAASATVSSSSTHAGWLGKRSESTEAPSFSDNNEEDSVSDASLTTPTPKPNVDFTSSLGIPPILFKDYFEGFIIPLIQASDNRSDWDNLSSAHMYTDQTRASSYAHKDPDTCRAACDIRKKCVQWVHEPNKCRLGTLVRMGTPMESGRRMKSGWQYHRIKKVPDQMGACTAANTPVYKENGEEDNTIEDAGAFYMPGLGAQSKSMREEEAILKAEEKESAAGLDDTLVEPGSADESSGEGHEQQAEEQDSQGKR